MEERARASETVTVSEGREGMIVEKRKRRNAGAGGRETERERARWCDRREMGKSMVEGREVDDERERGKEANERARDRGRYRVAVHGAREKR